MANLEKIKELNKKLHKGAKKGIAEKTGFSRSMITMFFSGEQMPSIESIKRILKATEEVIKERQAEQEERSIMLTQLTQ